MQSATKDESRTYLPFDNLTDQSSGLDSTYSTNSLNTLSPFNYDPYPPSIGDPAGTDSGMMNVGDGWREFPRPSPDEQTLNSDLGDCELFYNEALNSACLDSVYNMGSTKHHLDLSKITESETWDYLPNDAEGITGDKYCLGYQTSFSYNHIPPPSPGNTDGSLGSRRSSWGAGLSDSDSGKQINRSGLVGYDSIDDQTKPKTRPYSSRKTGKQTIDNSGEERSRHSQTSRAAKNIHSVVERRYRENLNTKILDLEQTLLATHRQPTDRDRVTKIGPSKSRKAEVLAEAVRYIKQAELEKKSRDQEIVFLRLQVTTLGKMINHDDANHR